MKEQQFEYTANAVKAYEANPEKPPAPVPPGPGWRLVAVAVHASWANGAHGPRRRR